MLNTPILFVLSWVAMLPNNNDDNLSYYTLESCNNKNLGIPVFFLQRNTDVPADVQFCCNFLMLGFVHNSRVEMS